jgi:hypothetical protein
MSLISINGKISSGKDTVGRIIQYLTSEYKDKYDFIEWRNRVENYGSSTHSIFEIKKFAGKLKQTASLLTGVPVEMFEDQEFKKTNLGPEWNYIKRVFGEHFDGFIEDWEDVNIPMTYREFLQKLGTEAMRDGLHTNVWVNALFADYVAIPQVGVDITEDNHYQYPNWIITDMRFPNEMEAVKSRKGITIRVIRDTTCPECGVTGGHKMYVHKDKSLTDLHPSETALDDAYFDHVISNNGSLEDLVEKVREILIKEKII